MIERPDWVVPNHIKSAYTTRVGGESLAPYNSFNMGDHVGDDLKAVNQNRALLKSQLQLPSEPAWLTQVHGSDILNLDKGSVLKEFDASFTTKPGKVCVIMTADCLPVLLCDAKGEAIAAVHCGWRSLAAGLLQKTLSLFREQTQAPIIAWLGPAIGPDAFEVGEEVRAQFNQETAFKRSNDKYLANIYMIAKSILLDEGLIEKNIYQTDLCTYHNPDIFYSYRRDKTTGRMASLIWKEI
jgi:YfiH family protein